MALFFSTVTTIVCTIHLLMTINDRATDAQLRRAAGSKCLEALKEAVQGWTAEEIDGMANDGKSALHMAAWKGSLENVKYLIETLGCDINIFSKQEFSYGKTPIFFAATQSRQDVLEYLLSKGVKVAIVNNKGQSVLSIASSHDMPASVLEQIRHLETRQKNDWWNFRESHSDGFEYGDLDPRFLDRPLRDTDIKTQNAINPTTKATRKNGFARRNPEAAKEKQRLLKSKHHQNKKKKSLVDQSLSEQEQADFEQAWGHLSLSLQTSTSSFQEDALLKIITLGEKQRRAWIPEATEKLEKSFGRDESCIFIQKVMRRSAQNNNGQRQIELLHKIIAKLNGVNRLSQFPNKQAGDISSNSPSSVTYGSIPLNSEPWKTACKLLQSLKISCLEKSGCPILRLSKPPIFVNTFDQLIGLQRRLQTCSLVAIDSEWCGQKGSNGNNTQTTIVSTIQISFFEEHPIDTTFLSTFVVDLLVRDDDFHRLAKDLIRWMIFPRERLSNILVLGFAIGHDLPLLKAFVDGSEISNATTQALGSILDLQLVFAAQAETKSSLPGLKACAKRYSSVLPLSKEQQCSDWSQRPLSQAQLEYAGLDAAILLVLLAESSRNMITRKSKS